jgi:hypothetical protein
MSSINQPANPSSPSVAENFPDDKKISSEDLPPSRKSRSIKRVSPPLSKISLDKFIYILVVIFLLIGTFYGYQMVQHKRQVGGWWNLLMGKTPITVHNQGHGPAVGGQWAGGENPHHSSDSTVQDRINALAESLGMPSSDLARAIADAVRRYVPPASLSSVAAKETGEAVRILTNEDEY